MTKNPSTNAPYFVGSTNPNTPTNNALISGQIEDNDGAGILLQPYSTLDEPVRETIMRDVRAVSDKLRVVILPLDITLLKKRFGGCVYYSNINAHDEQEDEQEEEEITASSTEQAILNKLRDWDLWGPLLICLAFSVLLSLKASTPKEASAVFAAVFMAVWIGAAIVTLNAKLLGGMISFFQCVCVLGYCIFPMTVAAFIITIFRNIPALNSLVFNFIWVALAFLWCTRASTIFIGQFIQRERRDLAVFPVFFFYVFLGWMVLEL
mmetsp:Transcript_41/g.77  ORF Transcript_41/g.77 Transcript_41/m.77 type:complete len:265 (+) Transcript_41:34-828(+)|eukprot:CAMPEP_0172431058 /NCGR_PEP_ID=MMETSP1064-20121228/57062_1 /TAXON_ID=202472 /ORGANISM="Aulacoseira subarctica , Strain CCAP 1002/5" /LENGTH=264 /DNA_ID=CAMNT_0013177527 /DNA_START=28 /DNA_END=822 /DNA_ORIENTATION=+